jgi:hypothetical protein
MLKKYVYSLELKSNFVNMEYLKPNEKHLHLIIHVKNKMTAYTNL